MSESIEIDDEVLGALKHKAEPFVDTPNSVLRRLLGIDKNGSRPAASAGTTPDVDAEAGQVGFPTGEGVGAGAGRMRQRQARRAGRAARGTLLPESEYETPMLRYLDENGGRAPSREVVDAIGEALADRLTEADKQPLNSGEIRWKSRAAFVRLRLIEKGDLAGDAPRGTWEITDQGRARLRSAA
jgi:hypothetical protein